MQNIYIAITFRPSKLFDVWTIIWHKTNKPDKSDKPEPYEYFEYFDPEIYYELDIEGLFNGK